MRSGNKNSLKLVSRPVFDLFAMACFLLAHCEVDSYSDINSTGFSVDSGVSEPHFEQGLEQEHNWVGSWGGARVPFDGYFYPDIEDQSFRALVSPTIGGEIIRIRFSNRFEDSPLTIGAARVALSKATEGSNGDVLNYSAAVGEGSSVSILFSGAPSVTLAASADVVSDPLSFPFSYGDILAVSYYVQGLNTPTTFTRNCIGVFGSPLHSGDTTADESGASFTYDATSRFGSSLGCMLLSSVDVYLPNNQGTVIVLGNSITEGGGHEHDGPFDRWPWLLARRIQQHGLLLGILNMGVSGNTVIYPPFSTSSNALLLDPGPSRFNRDVVQQTNVRTVIIFLGGNDLRGGYTNADEVIMGLQDMIDQGREASLRVILSTQPPGAINKATANVFDAQRRKINDWIRNHPGIDGWLPFDEVLQDPDNPNMLLESYHEPGDNVHPSDEGRRALADAVPLEIL